MKYKSRAIPLSYIKHGDSSIISRVLTEERGLQSFIVKGLRSQKSKTKISFFEPLRLLQIEASYKPKQNLHYIQEMNVVHPFKKNKKIIIRNFIAIFIAEINTKVLQENEPNIEMFNFIWNSTISLYDSKEVDLNFALKYLVSLSSLLGFYPSTNDMHKPFFNLSSGEFCDKKPATNYLGEKYSNYLKAIIMGEKLMLPQNDRVFFLKQLLLYYKNHHYNLENMKSHLIIEQLK